MKGFLLAATAVAGLVGGSPPGEDVGHSVRELVASPVPSVIGLGESAHDDPLSLAWRNKLILALVRQDKVRLVLLESGYAESRLLDAYVRGNGPLTAETLGQGFSNGLGMFAENRALIEAIRAINLSRPLQARIGVAGIDLSAGGPWGSAPGMSPVDCTLEAVPAGARTALRDAFVESVKPGLEGATVTPQEVKAYGRLMTLLKAAVPRSAGFEQRLCLRIASQGAELLATLPSGPPGPDLPADAWRTIEARDQAMADNVLQLTSRSQGRPVLLLSHLSHIAKTPMRGPRWSRLARPPRSMGHFLAARLGRGYRAMIEAPQPSPDACPASTGAPLLTAASAPDRTCTFTINRSDSQVIDLKRSSDLIRFLSR